jgi:MFS family permease
MAAAPTNIRMIMRESDMRGFQWVAVILCIAMTAIDGFDALAVSFTGPILRAAEPLGWGIDNAQIGLLGSAALAGMVGGSLLLSPVADIIGRRWIALLCLSIVTIGMFGSAFAQDFEQLLWLRVLTGVGIGAMFAPVNALTAEYSSLKRREFAISLMVIGYPLGAVVGGWIAIPLSQAYGWQSVFALGGVMTGVLIPLVFIFLPESMDFLLTRRPKSALRQVNTLLRKLGRPELDALPPPDEEAAAAGGLQEIAKQPYLGRTILIVIGYFMTIGAFYFVQFLTPAILSGDFGYPIPIAQSATIWMTLGGIAGGLTFGALSNRFGRSHLTAYLVGLAVIAVAAFGWLVMFVQPDAAVARWQEAVGNTPGWMQTPVGIYTVVASALFITLAGMFAMGYFINAAIAGFYASLAAAYPTHLRAAGTGWGLGVGRLGAVLAPPVGGLLLVAGMEVSWVFAIVGAPMIIGAVSIWSTDNKALQVVIALVYGAFLLFVTSMVAPPDGPDRALFLGLLWMLRLISVLMVLAGIHLLASAAKGAPAVKLPSSIGVIGLGAALAGLAYWLRPSAVAEGGFAITQEAFLFAFVVAAILALGGVYVMLSGSRSTAAAPG